MEVFLVADKGTWKPIVSEVNWTGISDFQISLPSTCTRTIWRIVSTAFENLQLCSPSIAKLKAFKSLKPRPSCIFYLQRIFQPIQVIFLSFCFWPWPKTTHHTVKLIQKQIRLFRPSLFIYFTKLKPKILTKINIESFKPTKHWKSNIIF